ncbi:peroxiredoxin [Devosia sp. SL43]|uniref:peroxiredoxin n=1 Tax=Devosia sp. SL43 TaxID=2806348 RepID=UPI001F354C45|nr:peroxiredoxin [Devosia sp. SL43]UJW86275.1 peroxiredoxin [Devosia sp. SL43]
MTDLREGDPAPDFTLPLDDGTSFHLAAQRGQPVVLYFYPEDDSGGCTDENKEFSDRMSAFQVLGARLVGISPDSIASHQKFRKKYGLASPLAADPDHLAIEAYGLWKLKKLYGREFMGLIRTSFIIGADGKVARIVRATRILGHAQKMLEALEAHVSGKTTK